MNLPRRLAAGVTLAATLALTGTTPAVAYPYAGATYEVRVRYASQCSWYRNVVDINYYGRRGIVSSVGCVIRVTR